MQRAETRSPSSRPKGRERRSTKRSYSARAHQYAREVAEGKILACKWVHRACERHLADLERSERKESRWVYDAAKGDRFCKFFEGLPHVKDDFRGHASRRETFHLEPWQLFIFCSIFGWVDRKQGFRRFTDAYIEVPRKNGKTPMAAGVALYCLTADEEFGAEVFAAASSKEQAGEVFFAARNMTLACPELREAFGVWVNSASLVVQETSASFKMLKGDPGDGPAPHCVTADEYHEYKTNRVIEWAKTGMMSRRQPLLVRITTAGTDPASPCYDMHLEVQEVLDGRRVNERLFGIIYTVDSGVDWKSIEAVRMANPNYGVSVNPEQINEDQFQARQSSAKQVAFKTKNLNIWQNESKPWINMEYWDACRDSTLAVADFAQELGVEAVDLASRSDTTSTVRLFKRLVSNKETGTEEEHYYCFSRHYLNEAQVRDERNKHFLEWVNQGYLIETPGTVTDYLRVNDDIAADANDLLLRELVYDPYHAAPLVQFLQARPDWNQGVEAITVKQSWENMSAPMKEFEALVLTGRFHHDGNPVLAWMVGNTRCRISPRDDWYPVRANVTRKIDGTIAILLGLGRLMTMPLGAPASGTVRWL